MKNRAEITPNTKPAMFSKVKKQRAREDNQSRFDLPRSRIKTSLKTLPQKKESFPELEKERRKNKFLPAKVKDDWWRTLQQRHN